MKRQSMEADLRSALEHKQFVLHYQPQLDLNSGILTGVEALVRWQHPSRGLVSPAEFIPVAEEMGLIVQLGSWVLGEACRQLKQWQQEGLKGIRMSVNLSALQFLDKDLAEHVQGILAETGLDAEYLDLEVTESMSMSSPGDTIAIMQVLSENGMTLSIDDFGTGYSSLAYLKLFPIHTLKIDRSFVKDIETDNNDADICDVTVLLAHKLGLNVVAEGVETEAQLKFLLSIGCNKIQGFLISKPLSADQAKDFINNYVPRSDLGTVSLWTTY
jgi:EAL domain-containing protein (putative c-di-GMP-specific phosphodiesterase class I)